MHWEELGREGRERLCSLAAPIVTRIKGEKEPQLPLSNETPSWWQQQQPGFT